MIAKQATISLTTDSIKKAVPSDAPSPVFAVKFIHKSFAQRHGRLSLKQLNLEITLHAHLCSDPSTLHRNIVQFFQAGEDAEWKWIAMELAEGGDLFDKIESDLGVGEDVAHVYFTQLLGAVEFMHGKGVGHRDIKPENVLLSLDGNLKMADFGLATLFAHGGRRKSSKTSCGSPPYTAPEVVRLDAGISGLAQGKNAAAASGTSNSALGYYADQVDVWSCGVVMFVLLVGNTPWDEPSDRSYEFHEYVKTGGRPDDELFHRLPEQAYDMLRGILAVDPAKRSKIEDIKKHAWFRRPNRFLRPDGSLANAVGLATTMFESMKIDFSQDPYAPSSQAQSTRQVGSSLYSPSRSGGGGGGSGADGSAQDGDDDAMDVDASQMHTRTNTTIPATQPAEAEPTPTAEITFDWEKPATARDQQQQQQQQQPKPTNPSSSSISPQPAARPPTSSLLSLRDTLAEEPTMSQFTPAPAVPLSRTQFARRFADILPANSMTRFYSPWRLRPLMRLLGRALAELGMPMPEDPVAGLSGGEEMASLRISGKDGRGQRIRGEVLVEVLGGGGYVGDEEEEGEGEGEGCQVGFVKMNGDPVEWRRLFKRVVVICREAVYVPEEY